MVKERIPQKIAEPQRQKSRDTECGLYKEVCLLNGNLSIIHKTNLAKTKTLLEPVKDIIIQYMFLRPQIQEWAGC